MSDKSLVIWSRPTWGDLGRSLLTLAVGLGIVAGAILPGEESLGLPLTVLLLVIGSTLVLVFALGMRRLRDPGPLVVVDERGIAPGRECTIPWAEIEQLRYDSRRGVGGLYIQVDERGPWWRGQRRSWLWWARRSLHRATSGGSQFVVPFAPRELSAADWVELADRSPLPISGMGDAPR
jgi:hypothetical protein